MNKLLTKIASLFFGMGLAIGVGAAIGSGKQALQAKAEEAVAYTLTPDIFGTNGYAVDSTDFNCDGVKWSATGNTTLVPWRIGGKDLSGVDREVWSQDAVLSDNVTKVEVEIGTAADVTVNSFSMSVGTSAKNKAKTYTATFAASSTITFTRPTDDDWAAKYFTFTFNLTIGSKNKFVQFSGAKFYSESSGGTVDVESVSLNKSSLNLEVGQEETLTATVLPANATNKNVSWSSDDETVATVDAGTVTAVGAGETTITVTTEDGGKTATCDVTVTKSPYTIDLLNKAATGNPDNYTDWSGVEGNSGAVYAGNSSGTYDSIQMRTDKSNSGIVSTTSGGLIKKIVVVWESHTTDGRTLNVYGNNSAYTSPTELYSATTQGTLLGTIIKGTSTELVVDGSFKFVGLRSNASAMYLTSVSLYWGEAPTDPSVSLDKTEVTLKTNKLEGVTVKATVDNVEEPTYSWTTEATNITLENATTDTVTIKPNTSVAGVAVVNLSVGGITPALTAHVDVTISIPGPGETPETAYTVAQARAALDDGTGITNVYAKGIVCTAGTVNNGAISYYITDDGKTTSPQLEAYKGKGINGAAFENDSDIQVGDEVVIFGTLTIYQQTTTYEFTSGNYLISLNRITVTLTPNELTLVENEDGNIVDLFENIEITQRSFDNYTISDIVWASDDEDVLAIVDDAYIAGKAGSAKLTASLGGKEYAEVSATVRKAEDPLTAIHFTNVGDKNEIDILRNDTFQLAWELTPTHPTDGEGVVFAVVDADAGSEISVTQEGLISAGSVPGVTAMISITSDHNKDISDIVSVTVTLEEMYIEIDGTKSWTEVADPSTLKAGDQVIATGVKGDDTLAMGTYSSGNNNIKAVKDSPLTIEGDKVTAGITDEMIYTLEEGATEGTIAFKDSVGKYLYAASSSGNQLKSQSNVDKNASFTLYANGDVVAEGSSNRNRMRYNPNGNNDALFTCYANDNTGSVIKWYKYSGEKILVGADLYNAVVAFNKEFKCDASGETFDQEAWELASVAFDNIDLTAYKLKDAISSKTGNLVEQFLARYDYAVGKWDSKLEADLDFLAREPAPVPSGSYMPLGSNAKSNAAATVIIIIAVLGVTAFGVYFLLRKRKEER